MLGSPKVRTPKQEKNSKTSSKSRASQNSRPTSLKLEAEALSGYPSDRKQSIQSVLTPTTISPHASSLFSPISSPHSVPFKLDQLIVQSKSEIEETYYTAEGVWAFKKRLSDTFDNLRRVISEEFTGGSSSRFLLKPSTPEVKSLISDLNKSKGLISNLHRDLEQKLPLLNDYEKKIKELSRELDQEKSKTSELSFKVSKLEIERDALLNTNNSIINSWKNNTRLEARDEIEITGSPISSPKQSVLSKRHSSFISSRTENDESSLILSSLMKENEELKKNLELIIHNYDSLCGKMKIQREDFHRYKELAEENKFFNEVKVRDLFFDLYFRVFKEEDNRIRINTQFSLDPEHFFNEVLFKYEKTKENFELNSFLLEKAQEENRALVLKLGIDSEKINTREKDLKIQYENELTANRREAFRQKEKKRKLKQRLNETVNSYQVKFLENQSLNEELLLSQSKSSKANEESKEKTREMAQLCQENELKSKRIQELSAELSQKVSEIQEIRLVFSKSNKAEIAKEKEYISCKQLVESLQAKQSSLQKLFEESEAKVQQTQLELKLKEAELKGTESKLMLQMTINERQKESFNSMKSEIIKKYKEKLDEKEKLFQDAQDLNESLAKKLESLQKTIFALEAKGKNSDEAKALQQEISDSRLMLHSLSSKLSAKTGESFSEPLSSLKDSIRVLESLCVIATSQLDSANSQVKLAQSDLTRIQEDLHKSQITIQELSLKANSYESQAKSYENDTFLLKEKCSTRKSSLLSVENQLKEKELIHLQAVHNLREKFNGKKAKLREKIRARENEIQELKKKDENRAGEQLAVMQDRERTLKTLCDEQVSKINNLNEEVFRLKKQKDEDEKLINKQNKAISKLEQLKEDLVKAEQNLKAEKEAILADSSQKIKDLQENVNLLQLRAKENDEESLEEDQDEYGEEHVSKLFKQIQEKELVIKKANKRIMELQWAHRDVIDQCKESEEKYLNQHEVAEKLTEENDKLSQSVLSLTEKNAELEKSQEDLKEKLKQFRESEIVFKKLEGALRINIEELKMKCENYEDEVSGLQLEISEFQKVLKTYAEENSALSVSNRGLMESLKKFKEEIEDINREKQLLSSQVSKLKQEISSKETYFEMERNNFEKVKDMIESQNIALERQVSVFRTKLEIDDEKVKNFNEEMESFKEQRKSLSKTNAESLEKVDIIETLRDQLEEKSQDLLEVQALYSDLQKEINDLSNDFSIKELSFNEKALKYSQDLLTANSYSKSLKTEKKSLEKKVEDLTKTLEKAKSEIYDKENQIKNLIDEKELMNGYVKGSLEGENLDGLLKVKECFSRLEERYSTLQEELKRTKASYEEIIDGLRKQINLFKKDRKASSKSMWTHVDQLTKQLEEKNRLLMEKDSKGASH